MPVRTCTNKLDRIFRSRNPATAQIHIDKYYSWKLLHPGAKYTFPFPGKVLILDPEKLMSELYYVKAGPENLCRMVLMLGQAFPANILKNQVLGEY